MRPLHLPSDSSQYAPPPSDNESDQDQLSLPAEDFQRQHRDVGFIVMNCTDIDSQSCPSCKHFITTDKAGSEVSQLRPCQFVVGGN